MDSTVLNTQDTDMTGKKTSTRSLLFWSLYPVVGVEVEEESINRLDYNTTCEINSLFLQSKSTKNC